MQADPDFGFRFKPNLNMTTAYMGFSIHREINNIGFRDKNYGPKGENEIRILALGDSFTEGSVLESSDTYVKQLEGLLNSLNDGKSYTVINGGTSGYGATQELLVLNKYGLDLEPDAILVFFYQNDPEDDYAFRNGPTHTVKEDCVVSIHAQEEKSLTRLFRNFLLKHSRVYFFMVKVAPNTTLGKKIMYPVRRVLSNAGLVQKARLQYFILESKYDEHAYTAWKNTLLGLGGMVNVAQEKNIPIVLIMIPAKFQVYDNLWEGYQKSNGIDQDFYNFDNPSIILGNFSAKQNIPFIDLRSEFRKRINMLNESLYYENDAHFNKYGNEVVAQILYEQKEKFLNQST